MPKDRSDEKAERELVELYRQREELKEAIKFAPPDRIAAGQALLRAVEADIEKYEGAIAPVQEALSAVEKALRARRQQALELLPVLDKMEKEPTMPKAALEKIKETRALSLKFLREDAEERGIPNDDH